MIELICPSYGRPEKMKRMWDSARKTAFEPHRIFLRLGVNNEQMEMYKPHVDGQAAMYGVHDWTTVYTLNRLAKTAMKESQSKFFMIACDDAVFSTPGWDKALVDNYSALAPDCKTHVYSFLDSRGPENTPHPIATREYIEIMGYLACPIFLHWYVDKWMVDIAKANGIFTHLKDYLVIHDKGSDRGEPDETHNRIRERGWHDRDSFVDRKCQHFFQVEKERLRFMIQHNAGTREHVD